MNIFVGNLNWATTEDELEELFAPYGRVDRAEIIRERDTGRSRGFGFVEMPNASEAQAAIDGLNGMELGGRTLTVNEARPREERGGPRRPRWSYGQKIEMQQFPRRSRLLVAPATRAKGRSTPRTVDRASPGSTLPGGLGR